jgi:hypothetical protein
MDIAKLKLEITEKIVNSNDITLLQEIEQLLIEKENDSIILNEPTTTYEKVRVFTAEEERKINLAIQQYENGECISDEEAEKEIQAWLED